MLFVCVWFSGCSTKKFLWTYSSKSEEEFVLFCDLPDPQKSYFYHRSSLTTTQGPERLPCSDSKALSEVQWYLQPQNGDTLREITKNYSHIILDNITLRFLTMEINNAGSYICRPRIRYAQNAFLSKTALNPILSGYNIYVYMTLLTLLGAPRMRPVVLRWS